MPINSMNPIMLMQMISQNANPQQMVLNMLEEKAKNNPNYTGLFQMAKSGNTGGIEQYARQMMASQGIDFDKEFNAFRKNWRL